jgi:hypothetical protein
MPAPFNVSGLNVDLSPRVVHSETVVASPAAAAETIIGSVTLTADLQFAAGVLLFGWAAFTVGTNGVSVVLRVRQTSVGGSLIASSGAGTETAANLDERNVHGFDSAPAAGQIYKLTMQVASGSAASTVSAVSLVALAV